MNRHEFLRNTATAGALLAGLGRAQGGATFEPLTVYTARHGEFVDLTPRHMEDLEAHGAATEYFRKIVLGEAERVVHPEETCNVQKVIAAIYRSSEERRALTL